MIVSSAERISRTIFNSEIYRNGLRAIVDRLISLALATRRPVETDDWLTLLTRLECSILSRRRGGAKRVATERKPASPIHTF